MMKTDENQETTTIKQRYMTSLSVQLVLGLIFIIALYVMSSKTPTKFERTIIPSSSELPERKPSIVELLEWQEELLLSSSQKKKLDQLRIELQAATDPIEKEIEQQSNVFQSKVKESSKRLSFADISRAARPATDLGRRKRLLEDSYSQEALSILTDKQRSKAMDIYKIGSKNKRKGGE